MILQFLMNEEKISIGFIGCGQFAATVLNDLAGFKNLSLKVVVTCPPRAKGRSQKEIPDSVQAFGVAKKLAVFTPQRIEEIIYALEALKLDFLVLCSYGQKIGTEVLNLTKKFALNVHPSLLPKYRGATPIQAALRHGDEETGVTIMIMNDKIDCGDIVLVKQVKIEYSDDYLSLEERLAHTASYLLEDALIGLIDDKLKPLTQSQNGVSYCQRLRSEEGLIDFQKSAWELHNLIRALNPEPGTYTYFEGKRLKILKASHQEREVLERPGTVIEDAGRLLIATKKGYLQPEIVQLDGKKLMNIAEFFRGVKRFRGSYLGSSQSA